MPSLLIQNKELFNGIIAEWKGETMNSEQTPDAEPCQGRPLPVLQVHKDTIKKEVMRLV